MHSVGIRELKNRLSYYLRYCRRGERLLITERGKPVAVIQPLEDLELPTTPDIALARLATEGIVRLRQGHLAERIPPVKVSGPSVSSAVIEDRR